jgi:CubicO group peptidase (beta-lactamase class C family)
MRTYSRVIVISTISLVPLETRASQAQCAVPPSLADGWKTAEPESSGFNPAALCAVFDEIARGEANIHGVIVERHGRLVAELYRHGKDQSIWSLFARDVEFGPTVLHDLRSVSKSMVSLLIGIARQQNKIGALTTPVLTFYPEYTDLDPAERTAITLENLLTMSSGFQWNESVASYGSFSNSETRLYWDWAPPHYVLSRPIVARPGSLFNYNGGGTAVLADVLRRTTEMPLRELARKDLFDPLGIQDWEWVGDLYGRPLAFAGLRMRPRDLAKIGRMLLDHGQWEGRQVVPADWVADSLRPHIPTGEGLQYGYQWWTGTVDWRGRALPWSAGFGNGGQRLIIVPELDLTVVVTAGAYNQPEIARTVSHLFKEIVAAVINGPTVALDAKPSHVWNVQRGRASWSEPSPQSPIGVRLAAALGFAARGR